MHIFMFILRMCNLNNSDVTQLEDSQVCKVKRDIHKLTRYSQNLLLDKTQEDKQLAIPTRCRFEM